MYVPEKKQHNTTEKNYIIIKKSTCGVTCEHYSNVSGKGCLLILVACRSLYSATRARFYLRWSFSRRRLVSR